MHFEAAEACINKDEQYICVNANVPVGTSSKSAKTTFPQIRKDIRVPVYVLVRLYCFIDNEEGSHSNPAAATNASDSGMYTAGLLLINSWLPLEAFLYIHAGEVWYFFGTILKPSITKQSMFFVVYCHFSAHP